MKLRALIGLALIAAGLAAAPGASAAVVSTECSTSESLDDLWTRSGPGWTGGDGAISVALPDDRVLWLFADTFLGTVNADRTRPATAPFVNNTFVVQDGACLTTHHGGTASAPASLLSPSNPDHWFWPGGAVIHDDTVQVSVAEYRPTGGTFLGFAHTGDSVATFSLPDLTLKSVTPVSAEPSITWGQSVLADGEWTYVYGLEEISGMEKYVHVARVPTGQLATPAEWRFFTGDGWSAEASESKRILDGVAGAGVVRGDDGYVLVAQRQGYFPSLEVYAYRAASPAGPWDAGEQIAAIPELPEGRYAYAATPHPQFGQDGGLVIGYSVNAFDIDDVYSDADAYRPYFLDASLAGQAPPVSDAPDPAPPEPTAPVATPPPAPVAAAAVDPKPVAPVAPVAPVPPVPPVAPVAPPALRASLAVKPRQLARKALAKGVRARVACSAACRVRVVLRLDPAAARKLRLPRRIGTADVSLSAGGRTTVVARVGGKARRRLKRAKNLRVALHATVADGAGSRRPSLTAGAVLR